MRFDPEGTVWIELAVTNLAFKVEKKTTYLGVIAAGLHQPRYYFALC